jgi:hypothetical protein
MILGQQKKTGTMYQTAPHLCRTPQLDFGYVVPLPSLSAVRRTDQSPRHGGQWTRPPAAMAPWPSGCLRASRIFSKKRQQFTVPEFSLPTLM